MEEDVLNALQTRAAYMAGGIDRRGRLIIIVNIGGADQSQVLNRKSLELSIRYLKRSLSSSILEQGVTVIVDAQLSATRITRSHARLIYGLFAEVPVSLYLVRAEGFWEKHVEPCTKSHTNGEPIVLSRGRLSKYFDMCNLPTELGGTLQFNYELWIQQRKTIDDFSKTYEHTLHSMEMLHVLLRHNTKSIRPSEADAELKKCAQMHASVQRNIESVIDMGHRILTRFNEVYATTTTTTATSAPATPPPQQPTSSSSLQSASTSPTSSSSSSSPTSQSPFDGLPPDLHCERHRIELRLNEVEKRQTAIRTAWLELLQSVREARDLAALEEGVAFVTNWILSTAEDILNRQQAIGCDVQACESLRNTHNAFEMECRETYGFYAELLYKIDTFPGQRDGNQTYRDLMSQKEFMHFVCRSFATRLERRRNMLITSLRFFRLVAEYFERTSVVFESLVMVGAGTGTTGSGDGSEDGDGFEEASGNLQKLKESQTSLALIERDLIREGEKLSDILAMPVKDALGRDLHIDYSEDICNVRDILETTLARRKIFSDSVELQKLTLEQVSHIHAYELDARMAIQWLDDLYAAMIRGHSHVGCNIHEIQVQKDELQTFQETGKSIYNYGWQLLEASQALRVASKLRTQPARQLSARLERLWHSLQAISQEHMTRLRVSAVFHRSVEEYCQQLAELKIAVRQLGWHNATEPRSCPSQSRLQSKSQQHLSSSGISSSEESTPSCCSASSSSSIDEDVESSTVIDRSQADARRAPVGVALDEKRRDHLRRYLAVREQLLVEVGRMVRLGRLLKTRLKEPFVLDAVTGKSVLVEDLTATDIAASPSGDSGHSSNTSNTSNDIVMIENNDCQIADVKITTTPPATIVVQPTGGNGIACSAISDKLKEIAEVAESLDAAIRDVQETSDECNELNEAVDTPTNGVEKDLEREGQKKTDIIGRCHSSEDWHSRSTEDDSFVTASEGNFTPHSHTSSSLFQTASGRTSSFISSGKNSFDASEADDSTFAFEMPELNSPPIGMSFDGGSEHSSFFSQHQPQQQQQQRLANSQQQQEHDEETNSVAGLEELHSESVTPTPHDYDDNDDGDNNVCAPVMNVESETELESYIADAPTVETLTTASDPRGVTPEVSSTICCAVAQPCGEHLTPPPIDPTNPTSDKQQVPQVPAPNTIAWRRSKYYENITKQTIKGFL